MGISARELLREKGTPYAERGLGDPALSEAQLLDAMMAHPILINRPIVVSPKGVRLCRPSEDRSEEHTSELQSLMRISSAVFCLNKKIKTYHSYISNRDNI